MAQEMDPNNAVYTLLDRQRFSGLWAGMATQTDREHCDTVFDELAALYSSPQRYYHCAEHICFCLDKLDESRESIDHPDPGFPQTVEMALWFHDAVYTAGDPANERNSASWFRDRAVNHLPRDAIDEVDALIVATTHRESPGSPKEKLLVDIDLCSFGLPWDRFLADGRNIRREFSHLNDEEFVTTQGRFLNELLERPNIYHTEHFSRRYESAARDNIRRILKAYSQGMRP
jgi:predicted metal-dependent HD superfamily phosphohydrolase